MSDIIVLEEARDLYECLSRAKFGQERDIERADIEILLSIKDEHLDDLRDYCDDYCFGTLILMTCGKDTFYEVMDELMCGLSEMVFRWIIDYDGKLTDGRNPLDTGLLNLQEMIDTIEMYYGGRYKLIYMLESYSEFPSYIDYLIAHDKENGRELILAALEDKIYTKAEFDPEVLNEIWENYHGA